MKHELFIDSIHGIVFQCESQNTLTEQAKSNQQLHLL